MKNKMETTNYIVYCGYSDNLMEKWKPVWTSGLLLSRLKGESHRSSRFGTERSGVWLSVYIL